MVFLDAQRMDYSLEREKNEVEQFFRSTSRYRISWAVGNNMNIVMQHVLSREREKEAFPK